MGALRFKIDQDRCDQRQGATIDRHAGRKHILTKRINAEGVRIAGIVEPLRNICSKPDPGQCPANRAHRSLCAVNLNRINQNLPFLVHAPTAVPDFDREPPC